MDTTETPAAADGGSNGSFLDDPFNMAMYVVLPCMVFVYGGCASIYCCHKLHRYCRRRRRRAERTRRRNEGDDEDKNNNQNNKTSHGVNKKDSTMISIVDLTELEPLPPRPGVIQKAGSNSAQNSADQTKPPEQIKPTETGQLQNKTTTPLENKPTESKRLQNKPAETNVFQKRRAGTKQVRGQTAESSTSKNKQVENRPLRNKPSETKTVQNKPEDNRSIQSTPSETRPDQSKTTSETIQNKTVATGAKTNAKPTSQENHAEGVHPGYSADSEYGKQAALQMKRLDDQLKVAFKLISTNDAVKSRPDVCANPDENTKPIKRPPVSKKLFFTSEM